jgi:hypothetical protein
MSSHRPCLKVVLAALVLVLISTVCASQTIRSQRKLGLLDGMTGVITTIAGTRVTIAFEGDGQESSTIHVKDATGLNVGDTVKMEGGRPVKVSAQPDQPAPPTVEEPRQTGEAKESKEAKEPTETKEPPTAGSAPLPGQSQQK